jgi:hypothetical protein
MSAIVALRDSADLCRRVAKKRIASRTLVVTDEDPCEHGYELLEGGPDSTLQIATRESCWLLVAARPLCVVETVHVAAVLGTGDIFALRSDEAASLHGGGEGTWLALRLPLSSTLVPAYREDPVLYRSIVELGRLSEPPHASLAEIAKFRVATRLFRQLTRSWNQLQRAQRGPRALSALA